MYRYQENHFGALCGGGIAMDDVFFPELLSLYETHVANSENPLFSFSITYQGHGPYDSDRTWWGDDFVVDEGYTPEDLNILNNYFGSIYNTNENLKVFTDELRYADRPVVLVLFGDHNPWMGDANRLYDLLGIDLDRSTQEGFLNYYESPYLIWQNEAAKEVLGTDWSGTAAPTIGPYFLMNELFNLADWEGPAFLQAGSDLMERVPVIHGSDVFMENGKIVSDLSPENQALADDRTMLEYYMKHGITP